MVSAEDASLGEEISTVTVEVLPEKTPFELSDEERQLKSLLEAEIIEGLQQAMLGFYQVGLALKQLKENNLHRESAQRFEDYAQEKFNFGKRYQFYLMGAVEVIDAFRGDQMFLQQVGGLLPIREIYCRELLRLGSKAQDWKQAWQEALRKHSGQLPPARTIREVVNCLKNEQIEANPFEVDDICLIAKSESPSLRGLNGGWAVIVKSSPHTCALKTSLGEVPNIPSSDLTHSDFSFDQERQIREMCELFEQIPAEIQKEESTQALLRIFGKKAQLSPLEKRLLEVLLDSEQLCI
jgi:hypothetical protein